MLWAIALFLISFLVNTSSLAQSNTADNILPNPKPNVSDWTIKTLEHVNIFSGELSFISKDFLMVSKGPKLALVRQYNSQSIYNGMFGIGWRSDFDINLTQDGKGNVTLFNEQGNTLYFTNHSGIFTSSTGNNDKLTEDADFTFTLTDKNGSTTIYGTNGRFSSRTDANGNALTFVYNPGQYGGTYIQDASGDQIKLYFDFHGHVNSAVDSKGKTFQYAYDINGNLVNVIDPTGVDTDYYYNLNHQMTQISDINGHKTYYQYDDMRRVVKSLKDGNSNKITFDYVGNNTTIVTDSSGKHTYAFDDSGSLTFTDSLTLGWGSKSGSF